MSEINDILADKCSLHGFCFINQKYGWTRENGMLNPYLYFKDNVHLIEQGNAKLASSILAIINDNINVPARGQSEITNHKNAVSFPFKDDDFPPLPSPALANHRSVGNKVGNPASNIMKPFHTKKFDVRCRPGTSNVCNTIVCVCNVNVGVNRSTLASHNHNFNVKVQHVRVSSYGRPRSNYCFHNRANGVKSSKTDHDLSVLEDVTTDFCSNIISEPIKSVLPRKSVSSKRLSCTSVST